MKILLRLLPVVLLSMFGANLAMAQFTILPSAGGKTLDQCQSDLNDYEASLTQNETYMKDAKIRNLLLGCAINTGRITFGMLPYFITYIANFLLSLGGIIAVLFIVIGGYNYIWGGITDQKEKGKKTILHALMGLLVGILSWVVVQVIITAVTS